MSQRLSSDVEKVAHHGKTTEHVGIPGVQVEEAVELYGSVEAAESYNYVSRG
jgi:hypothetical protein